MYYSRRTIIGPEPMLRLKNGSCALFVRPVDHSVPAEAKTALQLIVVGGPTTKMANEVLLSCKDKYATAAAVLKYLGQ